MEKLEKWKSSDRRKPLLLDGARQVGKTWILKEFGKTFDDGYIYVNFDKDPDMKSLFEQTRDIDRLIELISLSVGKPVTLKTLIILDEIQECEDAIASLKYFCEEHPEIYVAASGSLLGIYLSKGFPVGKVNHIHMYPMTFSEFLIADDAKPLRDYIDSIDKIENIPDVFFSRLTEKLKTYFATGGMPEAVKIWTEEHSTELLDDVLEDIIFAYERDMGKHPEKSDVPKIHYIWDSLPSQLAKDNKKFMYSAVRGGARAREYENALNWLSDAEIVRKVYLIEKPYLPIDSYKDLSSFKVYFNDIGIMRRRTRIKAASFMDELRIFEEYKGAFTENYVFQSMIPQIDGECGYWKDGTYEVDCIFQLDTGVYPVEVKSGNSVKRSVSIKRYGEKYNPECMIRVSMMNLSHDGNMINVPLFLADRISDLVKKI